MEGLTNGFTEHESHPTRNGAVETDFLVIRAGPAGAALACFLSAYGFKGIMVSSAPGTADTPRAHITNMATLECLRDIGLDQEATKVAVKNHMCMLHNRWCHSMAGEEYARIYSWGNDPKRKGEYEMASPCRPIDLPQTLLEPILIRHATSKGFKVRFDTKLLSFSENTEASLITATVRDRVSKQEYQIHSKYLFGADGARSQVVKQLNLPLKVKPGQGLAINVLVKADLSHLLEHRNGNLHWVMQPDCAHPDFGWMGVVRMVKPWNEWLFILFTSPNCDPDINPTKEQYMQRVREFIGDDTPAEIIDVSKWFINETVAEKYSQGNVFCLGDAVHRHPPFNGLGSNTGIQDAFNLAWKIAYVYRGLASPSLLDSYSVERQPVGESVITRANDAFREHFRVWGALGTLQNEIEIRREVLKRLSSAGPEGSKARREFQEAINYTCHEFHGLGIEMGQHYTGPAIYDAEEPHPYRKTGRAAEDEILYHEPSTYPGCRLPHAWLNSAVPGKPISTIDLAGHRAFTLFTGIGGDFWKLASEKVSQNLNVPVNAYSVGFRADWEDVYFEWEKLRGVEESGAVLVRPDRFVAWRANESLANIDECEAKLMHVMKSILGY
ncbi:hypothetical protein ACJ73_01481 [Blastomyces percursus]|uniref:FAD-binding domain-containing protein n=1 Tax=Blastomyces percursus TaxID=1658174 RepID=A0A1J9R433_9EURO|nr:hypothetical protein ACJ73_01481 [Blastomyces percursus]